MDSLIGLFCSLLVIALVIRRRALPSPELRRFSQERVKSYRPEASRNRVREMTACLNAAGYGGLARPNRKSTAAVLAFCGGSVAVVSLLLVLLLETVPALGFGLSATALFVLRLISRRERKRREQDLQLFCSSTGLLRSLLAEGEDFESAFVRTAKIIELASPDHFLVNAFCKISCLLKSKYSWGAVLEYLEAATEPKELKQLVQVFAEAGDSKLGASQALEKLAAEIELDYAQQFTVRTAVLPLRTAFAMVAFSVVYLGMMLGLVP